MSRMRAAAQRELHEQVSRLIPASERVNNLEYISGGETPVPKRWDATHVGRRLVDAFKTLSRLPMPTPGSRTGSSWPGYVQLWEDLLSLELEADETLKAQLKEEDARARNRVRLLPSHHDISCMETALTWPARYLWSAASDGVCSWSRDQRHELRVAVSGVAMGRARDQDMEAMARKLKRHASALRHPPTLRKRNDEGLAAIASGLRRDGVPVF